MPLVIGTECQSLQDIGDIPCEIISTFTPGDCASSTLVIYSGNGSTLLTTTWQNRTPTCYVVFNQTTTGTYTYNSSINAGAITVTQEKMGLNIIIGVGAIAALLLFFAFKLEEEHVFLKILMIIAGFTMLLLIPLATFQSDMGVIFYKSYLWIVRILWGYVFVYLTYWAYNRWLMRRGVKDDDTEIRR